MPKHAAILICITILTFANTLFNGFVGDDEYVIERNPFYQDIGNFPKIFSRQYLTDSNAVLNDNAAGYNSGSVAYRPVLSATYFLDAAIWNTNPFGFHLTNVLLHVAAVVMVYLLALRVFGHAQLAFLGALIFAVHPLKTEAVAAIGYRADVLAGVWLLIAFLCWLRLNPRSMIAAHMAFALALFTKEAALVFPFLVWVYERSIGRPWDFRRYTGLAAIIVVYFYIYLFVFPNDSLKAANLMGAGFLQHASAVIHLICGYIIAFVNPFAVKALPPLYAPAHELFTSWPTISAASIVVLFVLIWAKAAKNPKLGFFFFWFAIALLPVLNIIPIANPMAYRFMYLPSVGLSIAAAAMLYLFLVGRHKTLPLLLGFGFAAFCICSTMALNFAWKNNFVMARRMVTDFPHNAYAQFFFASELYKKGEVPQAIESLQRAFSLGLKDPRAYHLMGMCLMHQPEEAKRYYIEAISLFPEYAFAYTGLGRMYLLKEDPNEALGYLFKSIELTPSYSAYAYTIQSLLMLNRADEAAQVLKKAQATLTNQEYLKSLAKFFDEGQINNLPIDLGM